MYVIGKKYDPVKQYGLLGEQLQQTFRDVMFHPQTDQVKLLELIQQFVNNGYNPKP